MLPSSSIIGATARCLLAGLRIFPPGRGPEAEVGRMSRRPPCAHPLKPRAIADLLHFEAWSYQSFVWSDSLRASGSPIRELRQPRPELASRDFAADAQRMKADEDASVRRTCSALSGGISEPRESCAFLKPEVSTKATDWPSTSLGVDLLLISCNIDESESNGLTIDVIGSGYRAEELCYAQLQNSFAGRFLELSPGPSGPSDALGIGPAST
eukprot:scaffold7340_cov266-Pinguiococcus_pyrenoidosus.AAC.23